MGAVQGAGLVALACEQSAASKIVFPPYSNYNGNPYTAV
jgi:hypothetical protein